jgi:hypothetical protein
MNNSFISLIKIKHITSLIINYINNDILTLHNISKIKKLHNEYVENIIDNHIFEIFKYNIINVHNELLSYILESNDMGHIIIYRIQGMPRLEDAWDN